MENLNSSIWVDKYRPKLFKDIIGQENFIKRIQSFIKSKSLPHMLLAGSPGTGKTTTAMVVANELYGEGALSGNYLELNASDDRGIDVIRTKIKEFAKLKSLVQIPYKIICLDEADSLTKEAQQALRRTMEKFSNTCRFILCCNEISKLIDPIQSRCVIFKFKGLEEKQILEVIEKISKEENIEVDDDAKKLLCEITNGDLRKLINFLQSTGSISSKITTKQIEEVADFINPKEIEKMLNFALSKKFTEAREEMIKLRVLKGLTALEILKETYKQIISNENIEPLKKVKIVDRIATIEFRIVEGSDSEIQLESFLAFLSFIKN